MFEVVESMRRVFGCQTMEPDQFGLIDSASLGEFAVVFESFEFGGCFALLVDAA